MFRESPEQPEKGRSRLRRAASTAPPAEKKSARGALVALTESLAQIPLRSILSPLEAACGAFRVVLLCGAIPEERHQPVPESLQHMLDKGDHGLGQRS